MKEKKQRLAELGVGELYATPDDRQYVVEAGGCLHIAYSRDGRFVVTGGRRPAPLLGVTRVWGLVE